MRGGEGSFTGRPAARKAKQRAKEAGRKMLEKGDEDGTALVDVADMADAENTWVPLPRGHTNAGGQAEMGWVVGFKSY